MADDVAKRRERETFGPIDRVRFVGGLFALYLCISVLALFVAGLPYLVDANPLVQFAAAEALFGTTLVAGSVAYVAFTDRGPAFFDVRRPRIRTVAVVLLAAAAIVAYDVIFEALVGALGLPNADNAAPLADEAGTTAVFLWGIATTVLFVGPGEEVVSRGVVQKRLYSRFSGRAAVVIASLPFTLVHVPVFYLAMPDPLGVAASLAWVFGASLFYGWLYLRTENLVVPALVHGLNNAFAYATLYVTLTPHAI